MPIIKVTLWEGRTPEQKKEFAKVVTDSMVNILKTRTEAVQVIFEEIKKENWAIGGKIPE